MIVLEKDDHLLKIKLILKSTEINDEDAEKCFLNTEIKSENDINVLLNCLETYRPKLYEKLKNNNDQQKTILKGTVDVKKFVHERDSKLGESWSNDVEQLYIALEEYAALKISEAQTLKQKE